jgi:hypothetical protein
VLPNDVVLEAKALFSWLQALRLGEKSLRPRAQTLLLEMQRLGLERASLFLGSKRLFAWLQAICPEVASWRVQETTL